MVAGANFSHGSDLHHQSADSNSSHHSVVDQNLSGAVVAPHSHFEQENLDTVPDEIAVHCGSPELQPNAEIFGHNLVVIGAVANCFRMVPAGSAFNLEPPPPRS